MPRSRMLSFASLTAVVCSLATTAAAADQVQGTRSELLRERAHEIRAVIDHGEATLTVRRTVYNGGERHDQATFWIDVPSGAVAAGLRTRGILRGQPHWFAGELMEAEAAAQRYQELTGIGGYYPKDPALLSWRSQQQLALQVFPVAPGTEKMIEYTLRMPMSYAQGRYRLALPSVGTDTLHATMVVVAADPRDQLFVGEDPVGQGVRVDLDRELELGLARRDAPRVDGGLAVVPIADERVLVHLDVEAAARLSTIPRDARVVVAIDTSRSMDAAAIEAARGAAQAYLSHFVGRGARAEVVTFDREVHPRHGRFVDVRAAIADLGGLVAKQGNGSDADLALAHAARLFAKERGSHQRRIVLVTDALARERLTPAVVRTHAMRTGAVIHVVEMDDDRNGLERDDEHPWVGAARSTGGLAWQASLASEDPRAPEIREIYEEWARPVRIDALQLIAPGLETALELARDELAEPDAMHEGEGLRALAITDRAVEHVVLTGELWSRPVREVMVPSRDEGTSWAGLVFGSPLVHDLSEREMMVLATRGRVVSPVTSYLAIEPGVRPSTEGLDWGSGTGLGGGGTGVGTIGLGSIGTIGKGAQPDPQQVLDDELRAALAACGASDLTGTLTLQTTLAEIVAIDAIELDAPAGAAVLDCVREAMWSSELPSVFVDRWKRWVAQA